MTEFRYDQVTQHSLWTQGADATESAQPSRATVKHLRERLQASGASVLSTADLLAIVLGTGPSPPSIIRQMQTLLASTSLQELLSIDFGELSTTYQLGETKAAQLQALLEVARRLTLPAEGERYHIHSPADAATLVRAEMAFLDHEELRVLCLDTKHGVVANIRLYQGTINSSVLRVAEIFRPAVTRNCPGILICHIIRIKFSKRIIAAIPVPQTGCRRFILPRTPLIMLFIFKNCAITGRSQANSRSRRQYRYEY